MMRLIPVLTVLMMLLVTPGCVSVRMMPEDARNPVMKYFSELRNYTFDVIYYSLKFRKTESRWPSGRDELTEFAKSDGYKLDLSRFSRIEFDAKTSDIVGIDFGVRRERLETKTNVDTIGRIIIKIRNISRLRIRSLDRQKIAVNVSAGEYPVDDARKIRDYSVELWSKTDKQIKILNDGTLVLRNEKWTFIPDALMTSSKPESAKCECLKRI